MNNISIISAIGKNNEIGIDNHLIWKIKEDLAFYKRKTIGKNIIMGRKTFESMPIGALEQRNPIILSSFPYDNYYDLTSFNDFESLLKYIELNSNSEFMVVGGASLYKAFLPYTTTMYLTEINASHPADTYFPNFNAEDFEKQTLQYVTNGEIDFQINKYVRRKVK